MLSRPGINAKKKSKQDTCIQTVNFVFIFWQKLFTHFDEYQRLMCNDYLLNHFYLIIDHFVYFEILKQYARLIANVQHQSGGYNVMFSVSVT